MREFAVLVAILLVGAAMRAWLTGNPALAHDWDMDLFVRWAQNLHEHGLRGFYSAERFCDYPPGMLLIMAGVAHSVAAFTHAAPTEELLRIFLKVPACLADLLIGVLLYLEARRVFGRRPGAGTAAAALFVLNPVSLYDSAYWGQLDSIFIAPLLAALMFVGRRRWLLSGAATALALLLKFQAIALVPLVIFEAYRLGRWRGVALWVVAGIAGAASVLTPFAWSGALRESISRSYVNVVGQYKERAKGAFNIWQLSGDAKAADTGVPEPILRVAAQGRLELEPGTTWLLRLNWRVISLAAYAIVVAIVLSVYSLRPTPLARYGCAGLLAFAFFLFPTEMHERYLLPAIAFLAVWALAGAWCERAFYLLSALLLMNLTAVLPAGPVAPQIGAANLALFAGMLAMVAMAAAGARRGKDVAECQPASRDFAAGLPAGPSVATTEPGPMTAATPHGLEVEAAHGNSDIAQGAREPRLIPLFRWASMAAVVLALALTGWLAVAAVRAPAIQPPDDAVFLGDLQPATQRQGWGELSRNRSVSGELLRIQDRIFLRGLGTHAPALLAYRVPEGADEFRATIGIDHAARETGSARITIRLDGEEVFASERLDGASPPLEVAIPLAGARMIQLAADPTADGQRSDHVDWALARFVRTKPAVAR